MLLTVWIAELECPEANVIECFIVKDHALIGILYQLVDREGGIVGFNHGVRDLWRGENREVSIILSGYSSLILEIKRVPIPEPVPPPSE